MYPDSPPAWKRPLLRSLLASADLVIRCDFQRLLRQPRVSNPHEGFAATQPKVDEHGAMGSTEENISRFDVVMRNAVLVYEVCTKCTM